MSSSPTIELEAESVVYYSQKDEDAFFEWLAKIRCITGIKGSSNILYVTVQLDLVDEEGLRELLAIFHRYGLSMPQLAKLEMPEFSSWLRGEQAYWYRELFGTQS